LKKKKGQLNDLKNRTPTYFPLQTSDSRSHLIGAMGISRIGSGRGKGEKHHLRKKREERRDTQGDKKESNGR
jgi:hypothetical protein